MLNKQIISINTSVSKGKLVKSPERKSPRTETKTNIKL